jgi:hypothetical protein
MAKLTLKERTRNSVNSVLAHADLKLVRKHNEFDEFIPLQATLKGAHDAGLPVGDYIDLTYNVPGATQETIDKMERLGAFDNHPQSICEIGPGSGRYLEKVKALAQPQRYEIYEPSTAWRKYLVSTYGVTARECDGHTLAETPDGSIDLLHAHKVFPGLPLFTTVRYLAEMTRVVGVGGKVAFDLISEECLDNALLYRWLQIWDPYAKSMLTTQMTIDFFAKQCFRFDGAFRIVMEPGFTEYFVFTRMATAN